MAWNQLMNGIRQLEIVTLNDMEERLNSNFCESGCKFRDDTEVASTSE